MSLFQTKSILGAGAKWPLVEVTLGETVVTISAADAGKWALMLLEAADAARSEKSVFEFMTEKYGLTVAQAGAMIGQMRGYMARHTKPPTSQPFHEEEDEA
jgi:hypothetical protein